MFAGIIQAVGTISERREHGGDVELTIDAGTLSLDATRIGDSICVSGVCLTVTRTTASRFATDVSRETLSLTTLGDLEPASRVNLEPALRAGEPIGGHLVSGHVDGIGRLVSRGADARSERFEFELEPALARYVARKGSICIDGVSLTVNEVAGARFGVNLIPHTLASTTLGGLRPGARVNIEVDLIARYVERLAESTP
ncbi:MAG TPA: riboflavin synthase [Steroidobacteraceae bacterium]|jgi:riboflavin synthase|nr:riboflavin synthase [Steroidobacteraceae bacterium]